MRKFVCTVCGFVYDEAKGMPDAGIAPGTKWEELPESWVCPMCGAPKALFKEQNDDGAVMAAADAAEVRIAAPSAVEGDMRELTPLATSVLCSNLAKGCEKQYKAEEAALFTELADYFRRSAGASEPDEQRLLQLIENDLQSALPSAHAEAAAAKDRGALRALVWSEKVTRILDALMTRYQREGDAMAEKTGVYVCTICGFVYIGDEPPAICPVCKVPGWKFMKIEGGAK